MAELALRLVLIATDAEVRISIPTVMAKDLGNRGNLALLVEGQEGSVVPLVGDPETKDDGPRKPEFFFNRFEGEKHIVVMAQAAMRAIETVPSPNITLAGGAGVDPLLKGGTLAHQGWGDISRRPFILFSFAKA